MWLKIKFAFGTSFCVQEIDLLIHKTIDLIDITKSTGGRAVKAIDSKSIGISRACSNHVLCEISFFVFLLHEKMLSRVSY